MAARIDNGRVQLLTRTGLDWTAKYPSAVAALETVNVKAAYLDGELCGVQPRGRGAHPQGPMACMAPEEGDMRGYSTKLKWHGGPDHGWWVELLRDGERVASMSLDEWKSLGATEQAIEDAAIDRAVAADPVGGASQAAQ